MIEKKSAVLSASCDFVVEHPQDSGGDADEIHMVHYSKNLTPGSGKASTPTPAVADPDVRLSPRVEALRKLVVSGQYQVSPRHLAHQILRAAGMKPE